MKVPKTSVLALGALVAAVAATPALGADFSLNISAPASSASGQSVVVQSSGTNPPDQGTLYLDIDAIAPNVTSTCPSGYLNGEQLATGSNGTHVAFLQTETEDASGAFSNTNAFTPSKPGAWLLCAYTHDYAEDTLATASTVVNVGSASAPARPRATAKPRVHRSAGRLVCSRGSWANRPTRFSYRWLVDGHAVKGARRSKLSIGRRERGHRVRCGVTASNSAGGASALSAPFKVR